MGLPKNYRKNLNIVPHKQGFEQRQSILDDIANKGTYLPKSILHEDMDGGFKRYLDNEIDFVLDGKKVPVLFLSIQRWAEFTQTWKFTDDFKTIQLPFISIVRKPNPQKGTNYAGSFNIPGRPTFTYMRIPTWDGNRKGFDIYQIPQPVSIDFEYEVRLFCNKMKDLNKFNRIMLTSFAAGEKYLSINGHPIPLLLETVGDESVINNLDERRYYVQLYDIKMLGYLLDEDDFKVTPAINRAINLYEISEELYRAPYQIDLDEEQKTICISVTFQRGVNAISIPIDVAATYNDFNGDNISTKTIEVNGSPVTLPFSVSVSDTLDISITKSDVQDSALFEITGIIQ